MNPLERHPLHECLEIGRKHHSFKNQQELCEWVEDYCHRLVVIDHLMVAI